VLLPAKLRARGFGENAIRAQLRARRWRRFGRAILLHNGALSRAEALRAALLNCGPRAVLTSFTAVEVLGLTRWERDEPHVLVPAGTKIRRVPELDTRVHFTADWSQVTIARRGVQAAAPALVVAAGSFRSVRPGCGILAAGVQQRLVTAAALEAAVRAAPRVRHHAALLRAVHDIGGGSEALSEIDFLRLCRRHGLPEPVRQAVRVDRSGRRRYLDSEWVRHDGRRVVVEVDGGLHLIVTNWQADQLRQNEITIGGAIVLRFPSVVVRTDEQIVVDQLKRALLIP
jgi:hypothetical protein